MILNVASSGLLRSAQARDDVGIVTINHPLNSTLAEILQTYDRSATDLTTGIFAIIALSFVPASCVLLLIQERAVKVWARAINCVNANMMNPCRVYFPWCQA